MKGYSCRLVWALLFFLWMGFVLTAFYVVQDPLFIQVTKGLASTLWTLALTLLLLVNAAALGSGLTARLSPETGALERALLGAALGLGITGLAGFGLAAIGMARPAVLLAVQVAGLAGLSWRGWLRQARDDFVALWQEVRQSAGKAPRWIPPAAGLAVSLSFLLAFAPPVEAFDALLYHLTVPALWLQDGGIRAHNIPHYWFPGLMEGIFIWPLGLGSEQATQLVHLAYGVLTCLLVWGWAREAWGARPAWWALAVLLSMPSLPWLAAWAYNDLALSCYTVGTLYLLWKARDDSSPRQFILAGLFAGMAMGIKYTSFLVPLFGGLHILWMWRRQPTALLRAGLVFGGAAILIALPWYLRNWAWMGNPFYPFVFGGQYWDAFRARWSASPGSGTGLGGLELLLLPLNVTLGHRDASYFDGRVGPLWLILLPAAIWALRREHSAAKQKSAAWMIGLFNAGSLIFWTAGVINTGALWQSRLLFPALMPFAVLIALGIEQLSSLDTRFLRISFISEVIIAAFIFTSLLDVSLSVIARNPLAASLGVTPRSAYIQKYQPGYADALALVEQTPPNAYVYFLFEPRSYGMPRRVQPDPINDNLAHDLYLYGNVEGALRAWQMQGYSHVLISTRAIELVESTHRGKGWPALELTEEISQLKQILPLAAQSPDGLYVLYALSPP